MFETNERDRPCSDRVTRSSLGRATVITPASCETLIGSATFSESEPLGPLTETNCPAIVTSTPLGTAIGIRPIRDII